MKPSQNRDITEAIHKVSIVQHLNHWIKVQGTWAIAASPEIKTVRQHLLLQQRDSLKQTIGEMNVEMEHLKSEINKREHTIAEHEQEMKSLIC